MTLTLCRIARTVPLALTLGLALSACGPKVPPEQQLQRLVEATRAPVTDRMHNRDNSVLLADVLASDVLQGMRRDEVASTLGKGELCQYHELCAEQGFEDDDWYYDIGVGDEATVGKRPALILGFDTYGTVEHVYQLRIH